MTDDEIATAVGLVAESFVQHPILLSYKLDDRLVIAGALAVRAVRTLKADGRLRDPSSYCGRCDGEW